jgi:hypothetical protein
MPLPLIGVVIFGGIRLLSLAEAAFLLGHGRFRVRHWSLVEWITSWDAKSYLTLAARGYGFRLPGARPLPRGSLYPWFPGYPAAIRSIAWLPGVSLGAAAFIVTIAAGLAAAWGLTGLGLRLTGNPRVSLLMVALWAAAPGSAVFVLLYPEPLYCALAIWALVALTSRRWLTAAVLAMAAGTVQSEAIALIAAVTVASLSTLIPALRAGRPARVWWRPLAAAALAPLGLAGYLGFVAIRVHRIGGWFWIESAAVVPVVRLGQRRRPERGTRLPRLDEPAQHPADPGDRPSGAAHCVDPGQQAATMAQRLHDRGGGTGLRSKPNLVQLQAPVPAARGPARPPAGTRTGPAPDTCTDPASRRLRHRDDMVRPVPVRHRQAATLTEAIPD